jgi:hypothetical protein
MAMDWNAHLDRILRQLICHSFPELRRLRIEIGFDDLEPGNCLEYYTLDGRFGITVSPLLREAPRKALVGGIAHELAHIVRDHHLGPLQRDWAFERFALSRTYRFREERATDRRAVERGYGPQLMALAAFARRIGIRFERENGLLTNEIVCLHRRIRGRGC